MSEINGKVYQDLESDIKYICASLKCINDNIEKKCVEKTSITAKISNKLVVYFSSKGFKSLSLIMLILPVTLLILELGLKISIEYNIKEFEIRRSFNTCCLIFLSVSGLLLNFISSCCGSLKKDYDQNKANDLFLQYKRQP